MNYKKQEIVFIIDSSMYTWVTFALGIGSGTEGPIVAIGEGWDRVLEGKLAKPPRPELMTVPGDNESGYEENGDLPELPGEEELAPASEAKGSGKEEKSSSRSPLSWTSPGSVPSPPPHRSVMSTIRLDCDSGGAVCCEKGSTKSTAWKSIPSNSSSVMDLRISSSDSVPSLSSLDF